MTRQEIDSVLENAIRYAFSDNFPIEPEEMAVILEHIASLEDEIKQQGREIAELRISNDALAIAANRHATELQQLKLAQSK